ncbi:DNA repair protein RecO [Mucilaginibacter myungsuensis]|uniref:DNA repair protein RecO n=1 Tax=Mucilaginibacter myungsuensis TaxID=649104 RepID=A0A929KZP7_9SPHI|nr:DNA repair protein RecO [Mucilaginibacter myungsuensis]MBE9663520.1 DNA repair protein RecO [Mucilaginibacter myungsuensis]MDN3600258.1 DNA repair protein RecO [Mucilaginibacter myungsuensis]
MLHKTRGIVLKVTDYGENSVIVQVYTENFGLRSYIVNGAKKPKAKIHRNMLQPLHLLDMVVYHKDNGSVQRISELKNAPLLQTIPYDIIKSSLVLFLNEVLYKSIKQQTADEHLFHFIFHSIELLDQQTGNVANFHLIFLLRLSRYLGFFPDRDRPNGADYFDMKDGIFTKYKPESWQYLSPPHTDNFYRLLRSTFEQMDGIELKNDERRYLLNKLLEYYALHVENFGNIRSHEVLEEVLGS